VTKPNRFSIQRRFNVTEHVIDFCNGLFFQRRGVSWCLSNCCRSFRTKPSTHF